MGSSEKLPTQPVLGNADIMHMPLGTESDCQTTIMDHLLENLADFKLDDNQVEFRDYVEKINELHHYLDTVKKMVKPGCSEQVLKVALDYMLPLVDNLSSMSLTAKLHASL